MSVGNEMRLFAKVTTNICFSPKPEEEFIYACCLDMIIEIYRQMEAVVFVCMCVDQKLF